MKHIAIALLVALAFVPAAYAKPKAVTGPVSTNCGPLCGVKGMVCVQKQADGTFKTTAAVPGITVGKTAVYIAATMCWAVLP